MSGESRPRLRPHLGAEPDRTSGRHVILYDRLRLGPGYLQLDPLRFEWVKLFDGTRTLLDIQAQAMRIAGGRVVPLSLIEELAAVLDEALFLDTPRWRDAAAGPVRAPSCVG